MKRAISLLMTICMLLSLAACASSTDLARIDEILDAVHAIQEQLDSLPPDAFLPEQPPVDINAVSYHAEDSNYRRQTRKGTLTVGMIQSEVSFDPCDSLFGAGMDLIYDPLFCIDSQGEIQGQLAEEWAYLDATHFYIKIRYALFSNGDTVTAEDCLWSLRRFADSYSRWHALIDFIDFDKSECISSNELVLVLKEDFGPGIRYLASDFSSVLNKDYVEAVGDAAFLDQPVGSGPYIFVPGEDGTLCTFVLRAEWAATEFAPEANTVQIRFYPDSESMLAAYEAGNLDMAFGAGGADAQRLLAGEIPDTNYVIQSSGDICSIILPEYVEAFEDLRVRRAIAMAVDWAAVREAAMGCLCLESDSVIPDGILCKASCGTYEYDPDAAMVLLEEAGFDFGQSFEFVVDDSDASIRMAKAIQRDLLSVGINVHLGVCSWADAAERYWNGDTDLALHSLGRPAMDPDQLFCDIAEWSDVQAFRVDTEPLPTYLEIGRWSTDDAIREESYRNAQSWMYESLRQIVIGQPYECYCYRPYIDTGFWCESIGMPNLRTVTFS